MARRGFLPLFVSGLLVMASCGKKGPIEPPLLRIPQTIENPVLIQRGAALLLTWTNPSAYIDGNPLGEAAEVEIWMIKEDRKAQSSAKTWTAEEFEGKAQLLTRISEDQFATLRPTGAKTGEELTYSHTLAGDDFGRKVLTFSLRVRDRKDRVSAFSAPASLEAKDPPPPPQNVRAVVSGANIQVSWEYPEQANKDVTPAETVGYNVYRSDEATPASRRNSSPLKAPEFQDKDFSFGRTYQFFVRAVSESAPLVESDNSEPAEVIAEDIFPPDPPTGLTAIGGPGFIALSWEAGKESDLAGFRVWRRVAGEADFVLMASLLETDSSFSDSKVEKARKYEYAITAVDNAGNESRKSEPVSGVARDESP